MNRKRIPIWWGNIRKFKFVNRKYKDRLFQRVFQDKKDLLSLYNAINNTDHENVDDLEITTLEDVIFMSMKNDKSFIISSTMNLYEHQSTVDPNIPIRGLMYFSQLYDKYIKLNGFDIHGRKLIKLPMPQFVVFYNGQDYCPDSSEMKLSDAFECDSDVASMTPSLECVAHVLNVNYGHNRDLMDRCERLMHYSQFIARINENIRKGMSVVHAIDEAIDYCIEHQILADILSVNQSEVAGMLINEFDEKKFAKTMYSEGKEEGREEGHDDIFAIMQEINKGNNSAESLIALGYDEALVKRVLELK